MVDSPKSTKEKSISSQCECPTVEQLEEILHGGQLSCNHVDEVCFWETCKSVNVCNLVLKHSLSVKSYCIIYF